MLLDYCSLATLPTVAIKWVNVAGGDVIQDGVITFKLELPHVRSDVIVRHFGGLSPHCIQSCRAVLRAGARYDPAQRSKPGPRSC
jgi:hypothetical protein